MLQEKSIERIEYTAIIMVWCLVIILPLLFVSDLEHDWHEVHIMWSEYCVVGVAFIINRMLLMPRLFFAKQYAQYAVSVAVLFMLLSIFVLYFDGVNIIMRIFYDRPTDPLFAPPMGFEPHLHDTTLPYRILPPANSVLPPTIKVLILSIIVIALDMGLSIAVKWMVAEQKQAEINREHILAQLTNLQSQVSPHFFMNTLNNIHALVDIDSQRAKQTIIELSNLMDYLLYSSSNHQQVLLRRELEFISSYINLMRLRFSQQVQIEFQYDTHVPQVQIPPLLFLNFIENAFKYGVDYEQESFVKILFEFDSSYISMTTLNSNHSELIKRPRHGLGISNSRKRLDLIYGDNYTLDITPSQTQYYVNLKIPIT